MSKQEDRSLGMDRDISRRDILCGASAIALSGLLPNLSAAYLRAGALPGGYPPAQTGLRGNHVGSFEVAHKLAREGRRDWGSIGERDNEVYDLIVVGAGLSGLAAAFFYQQRYPQARMLIVDNHDDFGGHAKRNEFDIGGKPVIGYGGSQTLEAPSSYPPLVKQLLRDLELDVDRFYEAYDQEFFQRHGLRGGVFFDEENWGCRRMVDYDLGSLRYTLPLAKASDSIEQAVRSMPMSDAARAEMLELLTSKDDALHGMSSTERAELLEGISYRTYLEKHFGITEEEVFAALQPLTTDLGGGIEAVPAMSALDYIGLPGADAAGFPVTDAEAYIHHFPDGNASVARMLVRRLIPEVAPGATMDDIVLAEFDYNELDVAGNDVRLRLNSTAVSVQHDSDVKSSKHVVVDYVRHGRRGQVKGRQCILACNNAIIPALCPAMPEAQKAALSGGLKIPILYTNVALNNWRAWREIGIGAVSAPTSYHVNAMLDFPVDMGGYTFADDVDDPIIAHMERFPHRPNEGLSKREQAPFGRYELLATSFETIERNTRLQLADMLADGNFDPARDIEAITVNRWSHGYATRDWLEDDYYANPGDLRYSHVAGRQPFGRVAIANSDAGALATIDSAVVEAHRAVSELEDTRS